MGIPENRMSVACSRIVVALALGGMTLPLGLAAQNASQSQMRVATPKGWFGVMISDEALLNESGTAFFDKYPVVSKVEVGSPAAKAGVRPGDVLMTFNSHDMRGGSFQMSNWLKPGAPFVLKLRRNDRVQVVRGLVEPRPDNWEQVFAVEISPQSVGPGSAAAPATGVRTLYPAPRTPSPVRLPTMLVPALGFGGGIYPFAGAEFTALNSDLSDLLDVRTEGVFVTSVLRGSLARNSGLRGGDIVIAADSIRVQNPTDLVRAIRYAADNSVRLQVIRKHRQQTVVLNWSNGGD